MSRGSRFTCADELVDCISDRIAPVINTAGPPLVSIALCTYNGAAYLHEQLDSLLAQTHEHFEIIAVDDGSTDQTVEILRTYARRDSRVRVSVNLENLGFRRNFERTLLLCRGAFLAPCDQDDIWLPTKLSRLLAAIGSDEMAYCDSELIDDKGSALGCRVSEWWNMQDFRDAMPFVMANCVSGHAMIFRRGLVARAFPIPSAFFHDWWLAAVAASASRVVYVPEVLVRYRQHEAAVTDLLGTRRQPPDRRRGYGRVPLREAGERIAALATLKSAGQPLLREWDTLWSARETQWFSIALCLFMFRYRHRIYALWPYSKFGLLRRVVRHAYGLKIKRLIRPYKYGDIPLDG